MTDRTDGSSVDLTAARAAFAEAAALLEQVGGGLETLIEAARVMRESLAGGGKVLVFGNGGSAADAQHLATELVGRFLKERPGMAAIALTADSAVLTSVSNDYGYDAVFARQVEALGRPGDVAVGITTSGSSKNVNAALVRARALGLRTVGLTGKDGGETGPLVDVHVNVPHTSPPRVQEVQRVMLHVMCQLIERSS